MNQGNKNYEESKARYMTNDKKRYYLASVDENVQMLVNSQKEELTKVLIEHKSEYDALTRESRRKQEEEESLKHKIEMLELMKQKTMKGMEKESSTNENMKSNLETKKKRREEEMFLKKTLTSQINKLKTDTFLIQKEIYSVENRSKHLSKKVQKERLTQNALKERYNNVYSKITSQQQKNAFEDNEQTLQLQYYNTIIDHKSIFIQSADERKERQKKIAQEAKNNSADQMEEKKRKQFEMMMLYNKYLRFRMDNQLNKNAKMEETFQAIRDISGTQSLEVIADILLFNERHYNHSISLVNEQENTRATLNREIEALNIELVKLKTELPVEEETERNKKITPIELDLIEERERELVKKEEELFYELNKMEDKHRGIDLIFHKVIENMIMLSKEKEYLAIPEPELDVIEKDNVVNSTENQETNVNDTNQAITQNEEGENKDNNVKQESDEAKKKEAQEQQQREQTDHQEQQQNEQKKEDEPQKNEESKVEEEGEKPKEQLNSEGVTLPQEYEEIVENFNEFLRSCLKKFQYLFLCHSKDEFLKIMQEKGIESQNPQKTQNQLLPLSQTKKENRIIIKKRTIKKRTSVLPPSTEENRSVTEPNINIIKGELLFEKDDMMQYEDREVFKKFVDEMKKSREDYIRYGDKNQ